MTAKDGTPHASTLRKGRVSEPDRIYLVTTVTENREPLFLDFLVARAAVHTLRWLHDQHRVSSLTYVLMPDHLHWLFVLGENLTLSRLLHSFKSYSAKQVNRVLGRPSGRVWQPGFHDHAVRREEDLREFARYVVGNPVRAGLVREIGDYPHWDAIWNGL